MKKIKKILIALTAVAFTMNFPMTTTKAVGQESENGISWRQTDSGLSIMKTAKAIGDDKYEISLKVKGIPREVKNPADIILVMDNSGSMKNDMYNLKNAMTKFVNEISSFYKNKNIPLNMTLISFSGPKEYIKVYNRDYHYNYYHHYYHYYEIGDVSKGSYDDAKVLYDTISGVNVSSINKEIDQVNSGGGTDTKAALKLVNKKLDEKKNDGHDKYVVFFTDGLPTALPDKALLYNYGNINSDETLSFSDTKYDILYDYYYTKVSNNYYYYNIKDSLYDEYRLSNYYSIGPEGNKNYNENLTNAMYKMALPDTIDYFKSLKLKENYKAKVFSIGLFKGLNDNEKKYAKCLLNSIKNTPDPAYIIDSGDEISSVYTKIENEIEKEYRISEDTQITDFVPKNFKIVKNAYGEEKISKVIELDTETSVPEAKMDLSNVKQPSIVEEKDGSSSLKWDIGEITSNGIEVKFVIEPKDYYFGGDNIPTNTKAIAEFYDPLDKDKTKLKEEFNIPHVDIPYKKGSISISKNIIDGNEKKIDSDKKEFTICLDGGEKGKYYIKVKANGQAKTMNFYMRDKDTDISNNKDTSLNYLMVGDYTVKELDSLNCDTKSIKINGKNISLDGESFTVGKDNPNIEIEITNMEKNNTSFNDQDNKENSFGALKL
ncbi:VWA domain-containing protein [Clostridium sp. B9]|uniref:VWA domain-containing protein n=1 Tax=Clostridium sp. B9 TaxID=3423224 RepID=UPI003D2F4DEE